MSEWIVIGGGIAGLASAYEIIRSRPGDSILVLEAEPRLGGNIRTTREDGFTVEWGVNGFLDNVPETLALVDELGLRDSVVRAGDAAGRRFVFHSGRLREVPLKPHRFLASDILSLRGRIRVLGEPFARRRPAADETVYSFAARRIGREAAALLVEPMVSGIFAGDSRRLSLASTFPKMAEMEREHGGLVRAMLARRRSPSRKDGAGGPAGPGGTLTSFRDGMGRLVAGVAGKVGSGRILLGRRVRDAARVGAGYRISLDNGERFETEMLVVAAPARHASGVLRTLDGELAGELGGIGYAPLAVIALAYDAADLAPGSVDGFGFLVPRGQGIRILGCLWDSAIFPNRAPAGWVLLRAMIGGAQDVEGAALGDEELLRQAGADLRAAMGIGAVPRRSWIFRHPLGIPQYDVGHGERLGRIRRRLEALPGLVLAGNSYRGVAVNNCVKEARELGRSLRCERDAAGRRLAVRQANM